MIIDDPILTEDQQNPVFALKAIIDEIAYRVYRLNALRSTVLNSRELSLGVTNIEQGLLWLGVADEIADPDE